MTKIIFPALTMFSFALKSFLEKYDLPRPSTLDLIK
jgi:hypothetical protein